MDRIIIAAPWLISFAVPALLIASGCEPNVTRRACTGTSGPSTLVTDAAVLRLEVYDAGSQCLGPAIAPGSNLATRSQTFRRGEAITIDVPPGAHTLVLSTYADEGATQLLGRGCIETTLSPGAQVCVDLTLVAVASESPDLGNAGSDMAVSADMTAADDMAITATPDMTIATSNCPKGTQSGVLFCDGFEGANNSAPASVWTIYNLGGSATLDASRSFRGGSSLHLHQNAAASGGYGGIWAGWTPASFPSHFFARTFVYVPSGFNDTTTASFMFAEQSAYPVGLELHWLNSAFQLQNSTNGTMQSTSTTMPRDRWVCIEWEAQVNSGSGFAKLYIEGTLDPTINGANPISINPSPPINQFGVSLTYGNAGAVARDVWIDEMIVDTTRIGCTK